MSIILSFLMTSVGRWVVTAAGVLGFIGVAAYHQQSVGARKALVRVEIMDKKNVAKADNAAARSRDPNARGVLDPYTRSDK